VVVAEDDGGDPLADQRTEHIARMDLDAGQ
jgi:hypothetical protein